MGDVSHREGFLMGRRARPRAERLNEKIRQIREAYGWTQPEFIRRLDLEGELTQSDIQAFERDHEDRWAREPALPHLLKIARLAGVTIDVLVDPEQELPDRLPPDVMHGVVRRSPKGGAKKRSPKSRERGVKSKKK
jgi:transcriptional regulator with XRE-family HTH domain